MTTAVRSTTEEKSDELRKVLDEVEIGILNRMTYRLSDAIREGSTVTDKAEGWGDGEQACSLHAAVIAAHARGFIA